MKKLLYILLVIALTGCATTSLIEIYPADAIYENSIVLRGKTIPLPKGKWKIIGRGYASGNNYIELVLLKESKNKKMGDSVVIRADSESNSFRGYKSSEACDRKDLYHSVVTNNEDGEAQNCWYVSHFLMKISTKRDATGESYSYLISNNIVVPKLLVHSYHRLTGKANKSKYLTVYYYHNPENEGFDTSKDANWNTSDWHPLRIKADPRKVEYIEKVKEQGAILHEKIRAGFGN